jgi:hypothetical protein
VAADERGPDSGVRISDEVPEAAASSGRPLTYSMYTISDLDMGEARVVRTPPPPAPEPPRPRWDEVGNATLALVRSFIGYLRLPRPRPRPLDVCRPALAAFGVSVRGALAAMPWRRLAMGFGIGFGSLLLLLVVVMTVADLTDDLKPRHGSSKTSSEHAAEGAGASLASPMTSPIASAAKRVTAEPPPAEAAPLGEIVELDDPDPLPAKTKAAAPPKPAKPKAAPRERAERGGKPAPAERFIP